MESQSPSSSPGLLSSAPSSALAIVSTVLIMLNSTTGI